MPWFEATTESEAVLAAERSAIWSVLTDPELVAEMTPVLHRIEADGDLWTWQLVRIPLLGIAVTPSFTERMEFTEQSRIDYHHAPPRARPSGPASTAGTPWPTPTTAPTWRSA